MLTCQHISWKTQNSEEKTFRSYKLSENQSFECLPDYRVLLKISSFLLDPKEN